MSSDEAGRAPVWPARDAGGALFINARVDTFLRGGGDLAETIERANAYVGQ